MDETERDDRRPGETGPEDGRAGETKLEARLPGDLDPVQAYLATLVTAIGALVVGSLLFPRAVYDGFIWTYFWGPVYADAHGASCAVKTGEGIALRSGRCVGEPYGAVVGYNTFNEVGYALILLFALAGVVLVLREYDLGEDPSLFWGLLPFMFLGGALRVVEDAANAARVSGLEPALSYPYNAFLISPVIYFTMFLLTMAALGAALWLAGEGYVDSYERALAGIGTGLLAVTLVYLVWLAVTTEYVDFHPQFVVVTLVVATLVTAVAWWAIETYAPDLNAGTEYVGLAIIWGQTVDGVANVVGLDWGQELGLASDLVGKHPVNRFVVETTSALLPAEVVGVTGDAWPFLLLKVAVAVGVVALFDDSVMEESPRYSIIMLVAILAVGLGPGTRDMLRATFGI